MLARHAVLILALGGPAALAQGLDHPPGSFCWPMHYVGVVVGTSQDQHVLRLLGRGAHRPREADGVRYFVDRRATMTMKVSTVTDQVVGEIELERGVDGSLTPAERVRARTRGLDPNEGFGNWHALKLGSSRSDVLANLGPPAEETTPDQWVFHAECTCELPQDLTIHFRDGVVQRVVFSAPPG